MANEMLPPFFALVNVAGVQAVFGSNPMRVYPFGNAPEKAPQPYAVWQTISGSPYNYLNQVPDTDDWGVQVDVYVDHEDPAQGIAIVCAGAQALRDALESGAHIVGWRGANREGQTKRYRYSFDVAFVTSR